MRHRISIREPIKVIAVNSNGNITCNRPLPKKNVFVRHSKEPYGVEEKQNYRAYSASIGKKISEFKRLQQENKELNKLVRKNSSRMVEKMFTDAINNTKEE